MFVEKNIKVRIKPELRDNPEFGRDPYPAFFDLDFFIVHMIDEWAMRRPTDPQYQYITEDLECYFWEHELEFLD